MTQNLKADLVAYGKIYTAEKENDGVCQAFAVKDGKYIYVGDKAGAADFVEDGKTKIIDISDKGLIIPGCTEGHAHLVGVYGLVSNMPGFFEGDYKKLLQIIRKQIETNPSKKYFISWGFDYLGFEKTMDPAKNYAEEIEAIAPGIPVVLFDSSGHQALCNVTALERAGVADGHKVRGGNIYLTTSGVPNGVISDEVVLYVFDRAIDVETLGVDTLYDTCKSSFELLNKRGFTNCFDAYINWFSDTELYQHLKNMDEAGKLPCNLTTSYTIRSFEADRFHELTDHLLEEGKKYKSQHFNPIQLKLFADGVVEAKTGWILGEYPGAEQGQEHGNITWTPQELKDIISYANSKGVPVHTHTFGDGACKATIDAYIYGQENSNIKVHNTLAHVRNITEEDKDRCAAYDIGIAENIIWHAMDIPEKNYDESLEFMKSQFPEGIYENAYPMKSLIDKGIIVSSSTDSPAAELLEGKITNVIEVGVTGQSPDLDFRPFNVKELLSVKEALNCLTIDGARQLGIDDKCGSVKIGKYADFVILDRDFLDYKGEELRTIHNVNIINVYFEGNEVYAA